MAQLSFSEIFNLDTMLTIYNNWDDPRVMVCFADNEFASQNCDEQMSAEEYRNTLHKALKQRLLNPTAKAIYRRSRLRKDAGRRYAPIETSFQGVHHLIANTCMAGKYVDLDIVNAHPSFLLHWANENEVLAETLEQYVTDRASCLAQICPDPATAKKMVLTVMNGGRIRSPSDWFDDFKEEVTSIHTSMMLNPKYSKMLKLIKDNPRQGEKIPNLGGRLMNHILCDMEDDCLMACLEFLKSKGISTEHSILQFDGFKQEASTLPDDLDELLLEMAEAVQSKTGITVQMKAKPMEVLDLTGLERGEMPKSIGHIDVHELIAMTTTEEVKVGKETKTKKVYSPQGKDYLDQFLIYVLSENVILELDDREPCGFYVRKYESLVKEVYISVAPYVRMWFEAPDRRTVLRRTYIPYLTENPCSPSEYNVFIGFMHKFDPEFLVDQSKIQKFEDLLREVWAANNVEVYTYIRNWFAHKIQFPAKKIGTTLIVKGAQGAGKSAVYEVMENNVLGKEYCSRVNSIDELCEGFNSQFERTLMILGDEIAGAGSMYKQADKMKAIITRESHTINEKFQKARIGCPDYNDYLLMSNNDWLAKIEADDRRYVCLETSSSWKGKFEKWDGFHADVRTNETGKHIFHWLANVDLKGWNPRKIPMTEFKRELRTACLDDFMKGMILFVQRNHRGGNETAFEVEAPFWSTAYLYSIYKEACGEKKHILSINAFSRKINTDFAGSRGSVCGSVGGKTTKGYDLSLSSVVGSIKTAINDPAYDLLSDDLQIAATQTTQIEAVHGKWIGGSD